MNDTTAAQLEYARPALQKRRRWKFWAGLALLLCAIGFIAARYGADAIHRARLARYRQQCMNYTPPPGQVVYTNDPAEAAKLLAGGEGYVSRSGRDAYFNPPVWDRFNAARGVSIASDGTMFLHERRMPDGTRIIVQGGLTIQPQSVMFSFSLATTVPAGGFMSRTRGEGVWIDVKGTDTLRVFAGQPDPIDASRLTFVYELNGQKHTVDASVEDATTVRLESRDAPKTLEE